MVTIEVNLMRRPLALALLALTAACADPRADDISVTRADAATLACVSSGDVAGCPETAPIAAAGNIGQSASNIGASLTRSLMRLF